MLTLLALIITSGAWIKGYAIVITPATPHPVDSAAYRPQLTLPGREPCLFTPTLLQYVHTYT